MCAGEDSNLRRPKPTGLQPVVIDHSTTDANNLSYDRYHRCIMIYATAMPFNIPFFVGIVDWLGETGDTIRALI